MKVLSTNRVLIGRRSHAAGVAFENMINQACKYYKEKGYAVIEKTPEPIKILGPYDKKHTKFIAVFEKQAQPDYKGILCDGSTIIFEAKHTDSERIQESVVTETQRENFHSFEKMGARCFVMVSMGFDNFYRVPWEVFSDMKRLYGRKYMTKDELEEFEIRKMGFTLLMLENIELN